MASTPADANAVTASATRLAGAQGGLAARRLVFQSRDPERFAILGQQGLEGQGLKMRLMVSRQPEIHMG